MTSLLTLITTQGQLIFTGPISVTPPLLIYLRLGLTFGLIHNEEVTNKKALRVLMEFKTTNYSE